MQNIHVRTWVAVGAAIVVIAYVFWQGAWRPLANKLTSNSSANNFATAVKPGDINLSLPGEENQAAAQNADGTSPINDNQIGIIDVKTGDGREAKAGDAVSVHYDGFLTDGVKFDSSRARGTPFTFVLGSGQVIPGFDTGVAGMKVGGVRRIVIPASLGYGNQAVGQIPANSTLLFEVELVKVGK